MRIKTVVFKLLKSGFTRATDLRGLSASNLVQQSGISGDEAAQLLDVCDATVRRMTKAGTLVHRRTIGKHRRFRVSDVMRVFETRLGKSGGQDDLT